MNKAANCTCEEVQRGSAFLSLGLTVGFRCSMEVTFCLGHFFVVEPNKIKPILPKASMDAILLNTAHQNVPN